MQQHREVVDMCARGAARSTRLKETVDKPFEILCQVLASNLPIYLTEINGLTALREPESRDIYMQYSPKPNPTSYGGLLACL
jgi:hypothetical protein